MSRKSEQGQIPGQIPKLERVDRVAHAEALRRRRARRIAGVIGVLVVAAVAAPVGISAMNNAVNSAPKTPKSEATTGTAEQEDQKFDEVRGGIKAIKFTEENVRVRSSPKVEEEDGNLLDTMQRGSTSLAADQEVTVYIDSNGDQWYGWRPESQGTSSEHDEPTQWASRKYTDLVPGTPPEDPPKRRASKFNF